MDDKYTYLEKIGEGAFAKVFKAQDNLTGTFYAIKEIDTKNFDKKQFELLDTEIKLLSNINHKNIVKFYDCIKPSENIVAIILEYCNGGSLHKCLYDYKKNNKGKPFPEKLVKYLMKKILEGVNYLHNNKIIHRDLKLGNILLKYEKLQDLNNKNISKAEVKITDFNTSYDYKGKEPPNTVLGTLQNMAPSIIGVALNKKDSYDEKVDIWSLGTLCYEMLFGESLFGKRGNLQIIDDIYFSNIKIPDTISNKAKNFLYGMLAKKGEDRLTSKQLLEHEFLKDDIIIPLDKNLKINNLLSNKSTPEKVNNLYEAKNINLIQRMPIIPQMGLGMFNMPGMGFGKNMNMPDIFDDEEWLKGFHIGIKPAIDISKDQAKMNIIFRTTQGTTHNIILNYGTTIDEALKTYLERVGRPELKYNKTIFIYNATQIKFGDKTKIEVFFKNVISPLVLVNVLNLFGARPFNSVIKICFHAND